MKFMNSRVHFKGMMLVEIILVTTGRLAVTYTQSVHAMGPINLRCVINSGNNCGSTTTTTTTINDNNATNRCPATSTLHEIPTNGGQTPGAFVIEGALDSVIPDNGAKVVCTSVP